MSARIAFVTTFCPHHREKTFETLSAYEDVSFLFFSGGDEWYWQQEHGIKHGRFRHEYLKGFRLGRTRLVPSLIARLWRGDYDLYIKCINGRFALPVTFVIARIRRKPFILWTGIWSDLETPAHRFFAPVTRFLLRHADAIVTYGDHVREYVIEKGAREKRVFVAHHAVDNSSFDVQISPDEQANVREELDIGKHSQIVLFVGRLVPEKGLEYLIEAFSLLDRPEAVLVLAGIGSEQTALEQLARNHGVADRVRFAGYVPQERTIVFYSMARALILPSVTTPVFKEPWGLVVNEAFNQGLPVIATDAVGAAAGGLVEDGVNGFIVPERDPVALSAAIDRLLDDPALRNQLSAEARSKIRTWDNEQMVEGFRRAIRYVSGTQRGN